MKYKTSYRQLLFRENQGCRGNRGGREGGGLSAAEYIWGFAQAARVGECQRVETKKAQTNSMLPFQPSHVWEGA